MAEDRDKAFAELQEAMESPPPPHVRNINYDTHQGPAPQRPYARYEDQMGRISSGYASIEALQAALAALPDADAPGNQLSQDAAGDWIRKVPEHQGPDAWVIRDGAKHYEKRPRSRYVSLTAEGAKAASAAGRETDFFNGFTWMRRGVKPEKDMIVAGAAASAAADEDVTYELAPPAEQALLRLDLAGQAAARGTAEKADAASKPAAKKGD
jgi:hypothetical protein